jgi:phosphotransferase system HPr (HPr) family protein
VVQCAQQFKSQITLCHNCKEANACSLLQILTLGATYGADVEITVRGPDEEEAIDRMIEVFADGTGI